MILEDMDVSIKLWYQSFEWCLKVSESLCTCVIIQVNTIVNHVVIRAFVPRFESSYMIYGSKCCRKQQLPSYFHTLSIFEKVIILDLYHYRDSSCCSLSIGRLYSESPWNYGQLGIMGLWWESQWHVQMGYCAPHGSYNKHVSSPYWI